MSTNPVKLIFRPPSSISFSSSQQASSAPAFTSPPLTFLAGPWHVTHSTLPMWKSARNVVISYTPLSSPAGSIDDLVQYQGLTSDKLKTVRGIDTPDPVVPAAYKWRGKGLLMIASSQWELLGWGEEDGGWAVTYFQKTLFTPMGLDVYSRRKGGLSKELFQSIVTELGQCDAEVKTLVDDLFEVRHDL